jgi:hypothetical protein
MPYGSLFKIPYTSKSNIQTPQRYGDEAHRAHRSAYDIIAQRFRMAGGNQTVFLDEKTEELFTKIREKCQKQGVTIYGYATVSAANVA